MSKTLLETDITKILGIDTLSQEEQTAFLAEVGDAILELSLTRLAIVLTEEQHLALGQYLETEPEPEVLMKHLLDNHPQFSEILEEVALEFKEEAVAVLEGNKVIVDEIIAPE